ncbi:hypothetical protein ACFV5G_10985 [Streptomyces sp. NPDC059766]
MSMATPGYDDGPAPGRRWVVGRGSRIYVLAEPYTVWGVFDLSG